MATTDATGTEFSANEGALAEEHAPPGIGPYQLAWRRLRRNKVALAFGAMFLIIVVVCLLAPVYAKHIAHTGPNENHLTEQVKVGGQTKDVVSLTGIPIGPDVARPILLGRDSNGRDVAVRLLYGGRNSLEVGFAATFITMILAVLLGTAAGFFRGWVDGVLSRVFDVMWAYPVVILGVALGVSLQVGGLNLGLFQLKGNSLGVPIVIIGVIYVPYVAKPIRGQVLGLRTREFVDSARSLGLSDWRIMRGEILPNLASTIIVFIPLIIANAILHRGGPVLPRRGRAGPEPLLGHDDQRGHPPDPQRDPPHDRAGDHARPGGARHQHLRRRRARRAGPARQGPDRALMGRFILQRTVSAIAVLIAISILTFLIFQAIPSGDPALRLAGRLARPQEVQDVRIQWGFDKPIYVQYFKTMGKIFSGDVVSYTQQVNVIQEIKRDLPATLSLAIGAGIIWFSLGVIFGVLSALRAGKLLDRGLTVLSLVGVSTPVFFLGAMMLYYLGYKFAIFPLGGYVPWTKNPWEWFTHLLMPWFALSVLFIGVYSRVLRSTILDTINEDYVRAARAKGITERRVMIRHVLRNSLIPIVSLFGLDFAAVIGGGAILTESVFELHGVGQYAADSIGRLDVPPILVIAMLTAFFVVFFSAVVDIVYALLDPRIRL